MDNLERPAANCRDGRVCRGGLCHGLLKNETSQHRQARRSTPFVFNFPHLTHLSIMPPCFLYVTGISKSPPVDLKFAQTGKGTTKKRGFHLLSKMRFFINSLLGCPREMCERLILRRLRLCGRCGINISHIYFGHQSTGLR